MGREDHMKKNSIVIKGNKYGIVVVMDSDTSFDEIKNQLEEKLKESARFFGNGTMAISFEGRNLDDEQQKELLNVISESSDLNIACIIDHDEKLTEIFKKSVEKIENIDDNKEDEPTPDFTPAVDVDKNTGKFFRGTLRSGQILESDTSIVVIGDVNPGASVSAGGNIIILGSLKGTVSAGMNGDEKAFIVALDMAPVQVRIGDTIARCPERQKKAKPETKIAYLNNGTIYIDPLSKDLLNVLKF